MTMTPIFTQTVGAGGAASVTFNNIPQTFTDLAIKVSARSGRATVEDGLVVRFNGTTTGYSYRILAGNGSTASSVGTIYEQGWTVRIPAANSTSNTFGSADIYIPNYTSATNKSFSADGVTENNATEAWQTLSALLWSNTNAIASVAFSAANSTLQQGSTFTLYGVTNAATLSAKATGGTITADANYVYHTFTASGTFTPTSSLTADILVIAGGGGAGYGGGGAGGALFQSAVALTGPTLVTIGAGGAASTSGNNSVFGAYTATGGGRGSTSTTGHDGGSGGGAYNSGNPGNGVAGQGNRGGYSPGADAAGGGGGAGGVGGDKSGTIGGAGGAGTGATYSAWASATGTGVSGAYAGGGGGGGVGGGGTTVAGGGVGGTTGASGTANTGGGGGYSWTTYATGSGGSGIVIVRYAR